MKWNSEEGQKVLAVAYALQNNYSNAVIEPQSLMRQLVQGKVYRRLKGGRYFNGYEYSLQPFEEVTHEQALKSPRIVSKGRKAIDEGKVSAIIEMSLRGYSERQIAKELKVSKGTVGKYLRG